MQRRQALRLLISSPIFLPVNRAFSFDSGDSKNRRPFTFGWITDLHHGYCPDALDRLKVFIGEASSRKVDAIIQGGDFCHPKPEAAELMKVWNQYRGDKYHVLGNHDMDFGTKEDIMKLWGMPRPYYAFEQGGFHFIVMDCNHILKDGQYIDYVKGNFYIDPARRDLVNPEQIEWLEAEIDRAKHPCIIISHQSFDEVWTGSTVPNRLEVRKVIDRANEGRKHQKVIACICGHHHLDHHMIINGVHYIHINSASYYYVGDGFGSDGSRATYSEPVFAFVTFDSAGEIRIEGRHASFRSPTPKEKGFPNADRITASIIDRRLDLL
jgi:UDP-2,3-diacylglucosamine pyrophosphatase LpxH